MKIAKTDLLYQKCPVTLKMSRPGMSCYPWNTTCFSVREHSPPKVQWFQPYYNHAILSTILSFPPDTLHPHLMNIRTFVLTFKTPFFVELCGC